jgi:hypothetical protein
MPRPALSCELEYFHCHGGQTGSSPFEAQRSTWWDWVAADCMSLYVIVCGDWRPNVTSVLWNSETTRSQKCFRRKEVVIN